MLPYLTDQLVEEQTHAKSNQEEIIQTKSEFFVSGYCHLKILYW
jgi:hypothetical protein